MVDFSDLKDAFKQVFVREAQAIAEDRPYPMEEARIREWLTRAEALLRTAGLDPPAILANENQASQVGRLRGGSPATYDEIVSYYAFRALDVFEAFQRFVAELIENPTADRGFYTKRVGWRSGRIEESLAQYDDLLRDVRTRTRQSEGGRRAGIRLSSPFGRPRRIEINDIFPRK